MYIVANGPVMLPMVAVPHCVHVPHICLCTCVECNCHHDGGQGDSDWLSLSTVSHQVKEGGMYHTTIMRWCVDNEGNSIQSENMECSWQKAVAACVVFKL